MSTIQNQCATCGLLWSGTHTCTPQMTTSAPPTPSKVTLQPPDEGYGGMTWQEVKDFLDHIRETCMNDRQMWKERARGAEAEVSRLEHLEKRLTGIGWMCDHGQGHKQWSWSSTTVYDRAHCDECFEVYRLSDHSDGEACS